MSELQMLSFGLCHSDYRYLSWGNYESVSSILYFLAESLNMARYVYIWLIKIIV